jgi:hypothetical protein
MSEHIYTSFGLVANSDSFEFPRLGTMLIPADDAEGQSLLSRLRGEASNRIFNGRMMDVSDHYRAIPLSDGYHILFVDPGTDVLCLGIDAPVGGPTKLLRKIWFEGPKGKGSPVAYAGGSDLSWGVKVAAAYGTGAEQSVWFFSVPSMCFQRTSAIFIRFASHDKFKSLL